MAIVGLRILNIRNPVDLPLSPPSLRREGNLNPTVEKHKSYRAILMHKLLSECNIVHEQNGTTNAG
jgi:hypothetical protein